LQFISLKSTANVFYVRITAHCQEHSYKRIVICDQSATADYNKIGIMYIIQRGTYPLLGDRGCTRPSDDQGSLEQACLTLHAAKCPAPSGTDTH